MPFLVASLLWIAAWAVPAFAEPGAEPPVAVRTVPPDYPIELRRDGVSGVVLVRCRVDAQGNVAETQVEKSSNAAFEHAAVSAVRRWKFKPARQKGSPVEATVSIPIKFVAEN